MYNNKKIIKYFKNNQVKIMKINLDQCIFVLQYNNNTNVIIKK